MVLSWLRGVSFSRSCGLSWCLTDINYLKRLIEWPSEESEPTKYWLATLSAHSKLADLVKLPSIVGSLNEITKS